LRVARTNTGRLNEGSDSVPTAGAPRLRVLGVDPGTVALGWGVVEVAGHELCRIASGVFRPPGQRAERLAAIHAELGGICARFAPTALSLEQTFVGDNVQSAFRLGEARGAVLVAASTARLAVAEYSPAEIKLAVAGSGRASKLQMQLMVVRLLGIAQTPATDEADALGAAICHVYTGRFQALVAQSATWGARSARGRRTWRR
jgi:crossover junction endodeoxyribonuclease RuvC